MRSLPAFLPRPCTARGRLLYRTRLRFALALVATAIPASRAPAEADGPAADAATAARLEAHQQALAGTASVQADVLTRTYAPEGRTVGRVVVRGPNAYYRVAQVEEAGERVVQESVVTAAEQWTVNYEAGVALRVDMTRVRAAAADVVVPNSAVETLHVFAAAAPGSVQYLGPTVRGDVTLDHFRVTAAIGDRPPGELLVWVGPADGVPRRLELRSPGGRLLLERDFVNVRVGGPVPDALFALQIPDGMPVRDLTDEYLARPRE